MRRFAAPLVLALGFVLPLAQAAAQQAVTVEGANFERAFYLAGHKVFLNGAGLGSQGDAKPYAAGLYLSRPARQLGEAQAAPGPKRLQIVLKQEMDSKQLGNLLSQALRSNLTGAELAGCLTGLAQLGQMLGAKKKLAAGDQLSLDSVMGQGTHVSVNGQRQILIEGPLFFDCVLKGYLGAQPSDTALRQSLLAAMPR